MPEHALNIHKNLSFSEHDYTGITHKNSLSMVKYPYLDYISYKIHNILSPVSFSIMTFISSTGSNIEAKYLDSGSFFFNQSARR